MFYLDRYAKLKSELADVYRYTYKNASIFVMGHMFTIDFE